MPEAFELERLSNKIKFEWVSGKLGVKACFNHSHSIWGRLYFLYEMDFYLCWALGYNVMWFWDFSNISYFSKILCLKPFGDSYFITLLIITLCFTCGDRNIFSTINKSQNIMNMILVAWFWYWLTDLSVSKVRVLEWQDYLIFIKWLCLY